MGLVNNNPCIRRQNGSRLVAGSVMPRRQIRKEKVVVHNDNFGGGGFPSEGEHETAALLGACFSHAQIRVGADP